MNNYIYERESVKRELQEILDKIAKEEERDDDEVVAEVEEKAGMSSWRVKLLIAHMTNSDRMKAWTEAAKNKWRDES